MLRLLRLGRSGRSSAATVNLGSVVCAPSSHSVAAAASVCGSRSVKGSPRTRLTAAAVYAGAGRVRAVSSSLPDDEDPDPPPTVVDDPNPPRAPEDGGATAEEAASLVRKLKTAMKRRDHATTRRTYAALRALDVTPSAHTIHSLVQLGKRGEVSDAGRAFMHTLYEDMLAVKGTLNLQETTHFVDAFSRQRDLVTMEKIFSAMPRTSSHAFTSVVRAYGEAGRPDRVRAVLATMKARAIETHPIVYDVAVRAYAKCGDLEGMEAAYHDLLATIKGKPSPSTFRIMTGAYRKSGRVEDVDRFAAAFVNSANTTVDLSEVMETLVGSYSEQRNYYRLQHVAHLMLRATEGELIPASRLFDVEDAGPPSEAIVPPISVNVAHTLIAALCPRDVGSAYTAFRTLESAGVRVWLATYARLLRFLTREGRDDWTKHVYRSMVANHSFESKDVSLFNMVANSFAASGDHEAMLEVLADIPAQGLKPNVHSYAVRLGAAANDPDQLAAVQAEMEAAGVQHDTSTFHVMISNLGRSGKLAEMDRMREQMAAAGIAPTAKTMTVMMKYYGEKRDYASVLRLYHTMLAEGLFPTESTYIVLLRYISRTPETTQELHSVLGDLLAHPRALSPRVWKSFFSVLRHHRLPELIGPTLAALDRHSLPMTSEILLAVLKVVKRAAEQSGFCDWESYDAALAQAHRAGVPLSNASKNLMVEISARRRAVKTVDELIVDLNSAGFDLSVSARTEAIRLYGRVGQMAKVKALIPPTPAVPVLNAGLRALVWNGDVEAARKLFRSAIARQLDVNQSTFLTMLRGEVEHGTSADVRFILTTMEEAGFDSRTRVVQAILAELEAKQPGTTAGAEGSSDGSVDR